MTSIGLIVNPRAGRDIRRLVGLASVHNNHEKVDTVRRVLSGAAAVGVETAVLVPDLTGIVTTAAARAPDGIKIRWAMIERHGTAQDSSAGAAAVCDAGVSAVVSLGGDGTQRAVAAGCGQIPIVAVSTGTNNVIPTLVDGTMAGVAAGLLATGAVSVAQVTHRAKRVELQLDGTEDFALVDAAVCRDPFVGSRAIWRTDQARTVVLARADPWAMGLSSIGGRLCPTSASCDAGLLVELGHGTPVLAAVAPGRVLPVGVRSWRQLALGEEVSLPVGAETIALDGEREIAVAEHVSQGAVLRARVTRNGPLIVDIHAALDAWPATALPQEHHEDGIRRPHRQGPGEGPVKPAGR